MRLLLVDNHPLYLEGLRSLVLSHGMTVAGMAGDGLEALEKTRNILPDVILMEMRMSNCDGLTATQLIKGEFPQIKIIILSNYDDQEYIFEALKVGASGFLPKNLDLEEFNHLIQNLSRDEPILPSGFVSKLLHNLTVENEQTHEPLINRVFKELTDRQLEILLMVANGLTYKEIGAKLYLTERTVKYHMKQILNKLHLSSRKQAVGYLKKMQKFINIEELAGSYL